MGSKSYVSTCPASLCCSPCLHVYKWGATVEPWFPSIEILRGSTFLLLHDTIFRLSIHPLRHSFPSVYSISERQKERERVDLKELIKIKSLLGQGVSSLCFLWGGGAGQGSNGVTSSQEEKLLSSDQLFLISMLHLAFGLPHHLFVFLPFLPPSILLSLPHSLSLLPPSIFFIPVQW